MCFFSLLSCSRASEPRFWVTGAFGIRGRTVRLSHFNLREEPVFRVVGLLVRGASARAETLTGDVMAVRRSSPQNWVLAGFFNLLD